MHVFKCASKHEDEFDEMQLIRCPLFRQHIVPKKYLNHHLQGNCEEAMNLLRIVFQKPEVQKELAMKPIPDDYLKDVPNELLNLHNKRLLFYLKPNLKKI